MEEKSNEEEGKQRQRVSGLGWRVCGAAITVTRKLFPLFASLA
jgi:hypothetical protein